MPAKKKNTTDAEARRKALREKGARRARKIPVPVVTEAQLAAASALLDRLEAIRPMVEDLEDLLGELQSCIEVLDGTNAPEGWRAPAYESESFHEHLSR